MLPANYSDREEFFEEAFRALEVACGGQPKPQHVRRQQRPNRTSIHSATFSKWSREMNLKVSGETGAIHIAPAWRRAWAEVTPFFALSAAIRKIIYTKNAVESLNRVLRKTLKTKGSFPTEEAATRLIFLAIRNFEKGGRNVREWVAARNQLAILFAGRFDA